jgi:uncharacterized protein YdeI (BOF family)
MASLFVAACATTEPAQVMPVRDVITTGQVDQAVVVRGEIVCQQDSEHYFLRDSTGQIRVKIDDDLIRPNRLAVGTRVEVFGDVDTHFRGPPEIEAQRVAVLKPVAMVVPRAAVVVPPPY